MDDKLQDEGLVKREIAELERMKGERAPYEDQYREIEGRLGLSGFNPVTPGARRGRRNFDSSASRGLNRFSAAMSDITVPEARQYIEVKFPDKDLDKLPEVRRWCEYAGDRLYAIRYRAHAMFGVAAHEDFRQLGSYGTSPFWTDVKPGVGLFYKAIPLAETYIDVDYVGMVDTARRCLKRTARQLKQQFGEQNLTPKMLDALQRDKPNEEFEIVHTVRPNDEIETGRLDYRGKPVSSLYIAPDEKMMLRRGGYYTMPITVSRHVTSPGEKYGRSPAMDVLPNINLANAQAQTIIRAGHKAVDPALLFYSDDGVTRLVTKPGGANPGMVNEDGRPLVAPMPGGGNLPVGVELLESERAIIDDGFLGTYFKLLTDDAVQRSATAVLEIAGKQGVIVAPYASRYQGEKQNPITQREFEEALRSGQIEPPPPVVLEAGAHPQIEYDNPLRRMARAQEAAGMSRLVEVLAPFAQTDPDIIGDVINLEEAGPGLADALGVRKTWTRTADEIAARRAQRAQDKAVSATLAGLEQAAGATLDLTRAGAIASDAA
jgi:hypothetical protein